MVGSVGIAWASILSIPHAMLSAHCHLTKWAITGVFNFFIVIPN
jgi:hypothetical protein